MSYHKFTNVSEILVNDVNSKLMKGIGSKDFDRLDCNCYSSKVNGRCVFKSEYRRLIVVYKVECKECGMHYIGNTQQKLKTRIGQHLNDTRNLVNRGKTSDSFAGHFALHFEEKHKRKKKTIAIKDVRELVKVSTLWGGKPISCNKLNCYLCMHERTNNLESIRKDEKTKVRRCINNNSEIYWSCRHRPKFYRYSNCLFSVDDGQSTEKKCASTNPFSL